MDGLQQFATRNLPARLDLTIPSAGDVIRRPFNYQEYNMVIHFDYIANGTVLFMLKHIRIRTVLLVYTLFFIPLAANSSEVPSGSSLDFITNINAGKCQKFLISGFDIYEATAATMYSEECARKYLEYIDGSASPSEFRMALRPMSDYKMVKLLNEYYSLKLDYLGKENAISIIIDACRDGINVTKLKEIYDSYYGDLFHYESGLGEICK